MASSRLLLLEANPTRAERISASLSAAGIDTFWADNPAGAEEAAGIQHFDCILISSQATPGLVQQCREFAKTATAEPLVCVYGDFGYGDYESNGPDAVLCAAISEDEIGRELTRLRDTVALKRDEAARRFMLFDLLAFRQQMGEDSELMNEIIGIFLEESVQQLEYLREALSKPDFSRASREAHSLKGSLSSLHAPQARHWAQALEAAAKEAHPDRCAACFESLEHAIAELRPQLQQVLTS